MFASTTPARNESEDLQHRYYRVYNITLDVSKLHKFCENTLHTRACFVGNYDNIYFENYNNKIFIIMVSSACLIFVFMPSWRPSESITAESIDSWLVFERTCRCLRQMMLPFYRNIHGLRISYRVSSLPCNMHNTDYIITIDLVVTYLRTVVRMVMQIYNKCFVAGLAFECKDENIKRR